MKERKRTTGFLRLFVIALIILIVQKNYAQAPVRYYDSATGSGYTLKTQLNNLIKGHTERTYTQLWTDFKTTDKKANGYVWDMYSDIPGGTPAYNYTFVTDQCGTYGVEGDCYNREHSFPKSWFADGTPMYSDLFHLYPTDGKVNGQRNNYPFGEVGSASWTSTNGSKLGTSNYPGYTGIVFEPIDEYKGDFARTYFYMATRYENVISTWPGSDMLDGSNDQCFSDWALAMLIEWHNADPVSTKEINRNNAVYLIQSNRNPFIDHPEYVAKIWGGAVPNNPPSISSIICNPTNPKSTDLVNVSATITDTDGTITSAVLKWGLVSGSLTNTINLNNTSGSAYSTVSAIPGQTDGVTVYYKIEATDDSSDVTITSENSYIVDDETNTTIFFEDFETSTENLPININSWIRYEEAGTKTWEGRIYNLNKYAQFSAFSSGESSNISWLITPAIDLTANATANFSFISKDGYNNGEVLTVLISTNYSGTGNPALSTWVNLNPTIASGTSSGYATNFTESGNIDITSYCGNTVYIAYKYAGGDPSKTTTMQIDNVSITGTAAVNASPLISDIVINPSAPAEGESIVVSATITDSDGTVSSAVINYGTSAGNYTQQVSMSKSGNTFCGTIPSQLSGTSIYFVIEAIDDDSEEAISAENSFIVTAPHNNPPVISGIQNTPSNPDQNQSVTISAEVTDSDGAISYSKIKWGTTQGVYPNIVNMTPGSGTYSGIIPGQTGGTSIYFRIVAADNDSDSTVTTEYSYVVNTPGNISPVITGLTFVPSTPTSTETVSISATITDSDGTIGYAKIKWGTSSGVYPNQILMSSSGSLFSGVIPSQANTTHVYFVVEATDNSGGNGISSEQDYAVTNPPNVNPVITNINFVSPVPTSTQQVVVSATITDSDGTISSATVKWGLASGVYGNAVGMNFVSVEEYSASIPAQTDGTRVYFIIEVIDNNSGKTNSTERNYLVTDPPNQAPVISVVQISPIQPTNLDSVLVTASITDADGTITTALLKWKIGSEPTVYEKQLTLAESLYKTYIPANEAGKIIYFIIIATDNDNAQTAYMDGVYSVNAANSVEKTDDLIDIDIYPNPANEKLRIFFHNNVRDVVVSLLSIDGNTIYNKSFGEVKGEVILMLTHAEPGIYILQIKTQKNKISKKVLLK